MHATRTAAFDARLPLIGALVALVLFVLLALGARDGGRFGWDEPVVDFISAVAPVSDEEVHIDPYVDVATALVALLASGVLGMLLLRRRWREAAFPVLAVGAAALLNLTVKALVDRPAIETADGSGASFPSGTATWSMAVAAALVLLVPPRRRLVAALAGLLFAVGLGAVIAWEEWHYPSDVLGGWCLALGCVAVAWLVLLRRDRSQA